MYDWRVVHNCEKWALGAATNTHVQPKPLEGKPATFSQKSVTANANAATLAVCREDQRPFFVF